MGHAGPGRVWWPWARGLGSESRSCQSVKRVHHQGSLPGLWEVCERYSLLASGERSERPVNRQSLVTLASGSGAARAGLGTPVTAPPAPPPLLPPVPSAPPRKVEAEALNATAIRVLWRSPAPGRQHGQIRGYQVHYVRMEGAEARGPPRIKDIMLADAQVGGALGGAWGQGGAGSLRSCPPAASLSLSGYLAHLLLSLLPPPPRSVGDGRHG